jgi:nitroreductase
VDLETAIRTRRTHKAFAPEPVSRATLLELFELARWAPNHHLTGPWRFRVLGDQARTLLAAEAERDASGSAAKLDRAPTLIVASAAGSEAVAERREDLLATAIAAYIVLLGAHARGLAGYWRTVPLLDQPPVRAALSIAADEQLVGLLHLGYPIQEQRVPARAGVEDFAFFLP